MLNRIYIVVGILAIVVLASAFFVPRFVQWGDYRERMETLSSTVLGADVSIRGDISFSLLPSPRLEFTDVVVGDAEAPVARVAEVTAEFALMDFLRDIYTINAMTLVGPVVDLVLDENGLFSSGVDIAGSANGVALGRANIRDGSIRLADLRSDEVFTVTAVSGDLRLASFSGPFQFQGTAAYAGRPYEIRFNSGQGTSADAARVSAYLRQMSGDYSFTAEGIMTAGMAPKFDGTLLYRQAPPPAERADGLRGDLVLTGKLAASTDRVTLSGYTLHPDENRAGIRLTGSASIRLGAARSFDATISGGVFSLPPRPATEVAAELPYEAMRLLAELPVPLIPPMPGTLDMDLAEMGLRGFSLRDLRLDATTDGTQWTIEQAVARMPGDAELRLSGTVGEDAGRPRFSGNFSLVAQRLDALAQLWRRASEDNPLFNMPGSVEGRVLMAGDALGISNGKFGLDGQKHAFDLRLGFGAEPRLDAGLHLGALSARQTAALLALPPDILADASFPTRFPDGSFTITAQSIDILGLPAADFSARGLWSPGLLRLLELSASDWGDLRLSAALDLANPGPAVRVTGEGQIAADAADAPGLAVLYDLSGLPYGWQQALEAALPADLAVALSNVDGANAQVLRLSGALGGAGLDLRAELAEGLLGLIRAPLTLIASLEAEDAVAVQDRAGLVDAPVFSGDGPLLASLFLEGSVPEGLAGRVSVSQGEEALAYFGQLAVAPSGQISGEGTLDVVLDRTDGLAALAGLAGASLPKVDASATLTFDGLDQVRLAAISGVSADETGFSGELALRRLGQVANVTGALQVETLDISGLAGAVLGGGALVGIGDDGLWPEGPLASDSAPRQSRGDVGVTAGRILAGERVLVEQAAFGFSWTPTSVGVEKLTGQIGGGRLEASFSRCCSGPLAERTISGLASLTGVDIAAVLPDEQSAGGLGGALDAGLQFEGTGASLAEAVRHMTGGGNATIVGFSAGQLSSTVFPAAAGIDDALNADADTLDTLLRMALAQSSFTADTLNAAFAVAGGTARTGNFIIEGDGGRLAGSVNLALGTLGIDGGFVLTPRDFTDPGRLVETDLARILLRLGGTLYAPELRLDLSEFVAALQARANELEVERLEALQREDAERQRAAAEERNRRIEEERRRRAAEEEQRRLEEQQRLEQQQIVPAPAPAAPEAPVVQLELGFQPGVFVTP